MVNSKSIIAAVFAILLVAAPAAWAQDGKTLFCLSDGTQIAAERFETREGKFYLYVPGSSTPLEYPAGSVKGINTACAPSGPVARFGIHGSNTIGERLMPMLIEAYGQKQLKTRPLFKPGEPEEQEITLRAGQNTKAIIDFRAHGSETAAKGLLGGQALIGMSSRQFKKEEGEAINAKFSLNVLAPGSEHVLALDGLAVIVQTSNKVKALSLDQIAGIFAGEITSWSAVGGPDRPIKVHRRDDNSGTNDTFKTLVMKPLGKKYTSDAEAYESSESLSAAVSADPDAIGFIGLPYVNKARALNIGSKCGLNSAPSRFTIKTEEYPLARRLYLYTVGALADPGARALLTFALSDEAQPVVTESGFTDQAIEFQGEVDQKYWAAELLSKPTATLGAGKEIAPDALQVFRATTAKARRTSIVFRFNSGSAELDTRARQDATRLARFVKSMALPSKKVYLAGFADASGGWSFNRDLAGKRATAVSQELRKAGLNVPNENMLTLSYFAPVACNETEDGKAKNRRVEVWIER